MGKLTIEKWQCDRCGVVHDKRPNTAHHNMTVKVCEHFEWAGGALINWQEMCPTCIDEVSMLIKQLRPVAGVSRND